MKQISMHHTDSGRRAVRNLQAAIDKVHQARHTVSSPGITIREVASMHCVRKSTLSDDVLRAERVM